jgi:hypothetical protein
MVILLFLFFLDVCDSCGPERAEFFPAPFAGGMPPYSEEVWMDYIEFSSGVK